MDLIIDNEKISFSKEELDYLYLGEGKEANVYFYKEYALKIYNEFCSKYRLRENDALKLLELDTKRLLLPKKIVYDINGNMIGYLTLRHESYSLKNIANMSMLNFIEEIKFIEDDALYLGENGVEINDLCLGNVVYDGNINLVDPGGYEFFENKKYLKITNSDIVHEFVIAELLYYVAHCNLCKKKARDLLYKLALPSDYSISDYLSETSDNNDTVKKYVKRLIDTY